jgi:DNA-binding IclR family transcriptional regulator
MSEAALSKNVQALLRERLRSFEALEVLLLFHAQPSRFWTATSISAEIRLDAELTREALSGLAASGFIRRDSAAEAEYQYHPQTGELASAVHELAEAYREQHATVMSQMSAYAIERIRSGTIKAFADSFVLGKREDDG